MILKAALYSLIISMAALLGKAQASGGAALATPAAASVAGAHGDRGAALDSLALLSPGLASIADIYPQTVSGYEHLPSRDVIDALKRTSWKFKGPHAMSRGEYQVLTGYYTDKIRTYVEGIDTADDEEHTRIKESILAELTSPHLNHPDVWAIIAVRALALASAAAGSEDSEEIRNIFAFVKGSEDSFAALAPKPSIFVKSEDEAHDPAWKESIRACIENSDEERAKRGPKLAERLFVTEGVYDVFSRALQQAQLENGFQGARKILLPGQGKFGLGFGLAAVLKGFAPISMPYTDVKAHRLSMSPLWTATHDGAHAEVADPYESARGAAHAIMAHNLAIDAPEVDFREAAPRVMNMVLRRAMAIRDLSLNAIERASTQFQEAWVAAGDDRAAQTLAKRKLNTVLATLFLAYHERNEPRVSTLQKSLPAGELFKVMVQSVVEDTEPLACADPLHTDPLTGASSLSAEEVQDVMASAYGPRIGGAFGVADFVPVETTVTSGPLVWSAKQIGRDGSFRAALQDTLRSSWVNYLDENDLLGVTGLGVKVREVPLLRDKVFTAHARRINAMTYADQGDAWDALLEPRVTDADLTRFAELEDRRVFVHQFVAAVQAKQVRMKDEFLDWAAGAGLLPVTGGGAAAGADEDELVVRDREDTAHILGLMVKRDYETDETFAARQEKVASALRGITGGALPAPEAA